MKAIRLPYTTLFRSVEAAFQAIAEGHEGRQADGVPEHRRLQIQVCAQCRHQAAEAEPPGLLCFSFREFRLAGGRGMRGQVEGRAELAIERVHLETRVFRRGGEERRPRAIRFLPQLERE